MDFYRKINFIVFFGILVSTFVFAQNQDYLSIIGTLSNGQITIDSVEQRVFDQNDAVVYRSGSYEARILKDTKIISNNFFEIVENPKLWVDVGGNNPEDRLQSNKAVFNVKLLLVENLDTTNSTIEIWRGNNLLYSKKLIELPVEILAVNTHTVLNQKNSPNLSYLFHLYYDNGQLFANRDFEFKYDVIPEIFVPETLNTQFPYKGEVVNLKGEIAETFQFDPRQGDSKFLKGKISVKAPYVPDAQKVNFYDGQGNQLLSIFVSESSFCNDDGACNPDVGEDTKTCPNDCKTATPIPTVSTEPSTGSEAGGVIKILFYSIIGLVVAGGVWYGWKKVKKETIFTPPPPAL